MSGRIDAACSVKEKATGNHAVDIVCKAFAVKHNLTKIRRPQTNGTVERFNRRINEAISKKSKISTNSGKNSFDSHEERNEFIMQFIDSYNRTRLRCLQYSAPVELLYSNHQKYNTSAGMTTL
ncbi:MAG: integrase core domain-containing protein [Alphaproteobacteria bacterium]